MTRLLRNLGLLFFLLLISASLWVVFRTEAPDVPSRRRVSLRRDVAENIRVSRYGIYGVDFIKCGRVHLEKVRRGPFALGGFNILVLDDLKVVLPPSGKVLGSEKNDQRKETAVSSLSALRDLGIGSDFLKANGIAKRFSGLRINGLELGRLDAETNVVRVLTARRAELKRSGIELSDVILNENGVERKLPRAVLGKSDGALLVSWPSGKSFL